MDRLFQGEIERSGRYSSTNRKTNEEIVEPCNHRKERAKQCVDIHSEPEIAEISQMLLLSIADMIIAVGMVSFLPDGMFTLVTDFGNIKHP